METLVVLIRTQAERRGETTPQELRGLVEHVGSGRRQPFAGRLEKVDLAWSGPSGRSFDVYRNGTRMATVEATAYTDNINKRGSGGYSYKVCAAQASVCSNEATVTF
jgi:hypothetical protein